MLIGYARVSTQEQETHLQVDALRKAGVLLIHEEKRSGGDRKRPVLEHVLQQIGPGTTLVVFKLDRVARSLAHLLEILDRISAQGGSFHSLTEHIETTSPAGRMMMQIIGAFAEFERELIRERTRAGMEAAAARGVKFGRDRALDLDDEAEVVRRWRAGGVTKTALAKQYGIHISSVKRYIRRANAVDDLFADAALAISSRRGLRLDQG